MITENELNALKGLLHYLNGNVLPPNSTIAVEAKLVDANGEYIGTLDFNPATDSYCFYPAGGNDA